MINIFIVEDNQMLLQNICFLLNGEKDINVSGKATNAEEALKKIDLENTDILLTDLGLPNMHGVELIEEIKAKNPNISIIVNTIFEDNDTVFEAIKKGAVGYILKTSSPRKLIDAVFEIYEGGAPMSPKIARKVIAQMQSSLIPEQHILSHREKEVLKAIEKGLSYTQTAKELSVSVHTVNSHIKNIYQKLSASSKSEAIIKAKQKGII